MKFSMSERRGIITVVAKRYQKARKKLRSHILHEFVELTGYRRSYAAFVLRNWKRRRVLTIGGLRTVYVFGPRPRTRRNVPKRPPTYGPPVVRALKRLWAISGGLCGKRLAPSIKLLLVALERFEEIALDADTRQKLLRISPATIDRLLAPERRKTQIRARTRTKPGSLLKHHVPIRTFAQWDEKIPGFVEIDLVAHDGGIPGAEVIHSLNLTDVATGWTETRALRTKAQRWDLEALAEITTTLPFPLHGIDCDNGAEFINTELFGYCKTHQITFTRSRPYHKNDSCYVEQKNYSIVRTAVGYARYDTEAELLLLRPLYQALGPLTNFFVPVMKLQSKTRNGSKVSKTYDMPQTPVQRVLAHPETEPRTAARVKRLHRTLNPAMLRRTITQIQQELERIASNKPKPRPSYRYRKQLESLLT